MIANLRCCKRGRIVASIASDMEMNDASLPGKSLFVVAEDY